MGVARPGFWSRWYAGHVVTLVASVAVLTLSFIITPSTGFLDLQGITIPELCAWRRFFGIECLGCGLTRSFVFIGHGDWQAAWDMNRIGPFLYALVAFQVPYRAFRLWRPTQRDRQRAARWSSAIT